MPRRSLFRRHDPAAQARYADVKRLAEAQGRVLAGTPGTLKARTQSGRRYWVREHIRVDGSKVDEYLGAESGIDANRLALLREEIELARTLAAGSAQLRLHGYQRIERKPAAVLAALHNGGLLSGALVLVGSHAFGALLNELGILAAGYRTQDLDLARAHPLAVARAGGASFGEALAGSGLGFVPVPGMPSHAPSASFKLPGAEALAVDLLAAGDTAGRVVPVKELGAHAQTVPLLDHLVAECTQGIVLSPNQVIPVRLPAPERLLAHKLFASQSRRTNREKARKDLEQAALLAAAIEEQTPGAIADAVRRFPVPGRAAVKRGAHAAAALLAGMHAEAEAALARAAAR